VIVAHPANGAVEILDGPGLRLERTLPGCSEGSGVLYAPGDPELVFAAARGDGANIRIRDKALLHLAHECAQE
jgi:hypothetical protein